MNNQKKYNPLKKFISLTGQTLYIRILIVTFVFLFAIISSKIVSPAQGKDSNIFAFLNVTLVPMTNDNTIQNQTVVIKGNKIVNIGFSDQITIPTDAKVINGNGAFLMPALSDMHTHTNFNWNERSGFWRISPFYLYLANGVTTIRCFGPEGGDQNRLKQLMN